MRKMLEDTENAWTIVCHEYSAQPIDLRNNINVVLNEYIETQIAQLNVDLMTKLENLKIDISNHNRLHPNEKRSFTNEKRAFKKMVRKDFPIKSTKLNATYEENDFIAYDEFLDMILAMNANTQTSPFHVEVTKVAPTAL